MKRVPLTLVWLFAGCSAASSSGRTTAQVRATPRVVSALADSDFDGIPNDRDQCPLDAEDRDGFEDEDGCHEHDNDCDGVADVEDLCENDAEDHDGFEDSDGCPEPDNDRDRIADRCDRCPNDPETYNGCSDLDGCPDHSVCGMVSSPVLILDAVAFAANRERMTHEGRAKLSDVIASLQGQRDIGQLVLVGHVADGERGGVRLALARANAVRSAILQAGVRAVTISVRGVGDMHPVQPHVRRVTVGYVEFVVLAYGGRTQFTWQRDRFVEIESNELASNACNEPAMECGAEPAAAPRSRGCR